MKSYDKHLQTTGTVGTRVDHRRKPCFRASAAFVALQKGSLSTRILFCNYWKLKRGIPEVNVLTTLRNADGAVVYRTSMLVDEAKAFAVYLQQLLEGGGLDSKADFVGSIECEIFATRNLVFPFPAVVLNYFNPEAMAAVHTAGRIFNDLEDMSENSETPVPESGFDVLSSDRLQPFFNFVNGPFAEENKTIRYELIGEDNRRETGEIVLGDIPSYGVVHVDLSDHVRQLSTGRGAMKIFHDLRGFFPRFVAGNLDNETDAVSITHTYYDCTTQNGDANYWTNEDGRLQDSAVFVPVWAEGDFYTEVVFYPIFSPTQFKIHLEFYDGEGGQLGQVPDWKTVETGADGVFAANPGDIVRERLDVRLLSRVKGMKVVKEWPRGSRIPTRLKFGLNVGIRGREVDLPTNICFNSMVANPMLLGKSGTFRWVPILNHARSVVVIDHFSFLKEPREPANLTLSFYREADTETIERAAVIPENGQLRVDLGDDAEVRDFLGEDTGWLIVEADSPFVETWYFEFSESGAIGGDHGF